MNMKMLASVAVVAAVLLLGFMPTGGGEVTHDLELTVHGYEQSPPEGDRLFIYILSNDDLRVEESVSPSQSFFGGLLGGMAIVPQDWRVALTLYELTPETQWGVTLIRSASPVQLSVPPGTGPDSASEWTFGIPIDGLGAGEYRLTATSQHLAGGSWGGVQETDINFELDDSYGILRKW